MGGLVGVLCWGGALLSAAANPDPYGADPELYYAVQHQAQVYSLPDSSKPFVRLSFQEPVHLVARGGDWCEVETMDGAGGFTPCATISNVWIHVSKPKQRVDVYRGPERVKAIKADLGYNKFADKEQRGSTRFRDHWRTPEGRFYVVDKNPNSEFHKAFVLNYPTSGDARRGLKRGLISETEHDAILEAQAQFVMPPMDTALGGWIEIHGDGTGRAANWTQGCVAIPNDEMDALWSWVEVGTPVLIE